MLKNKFIIFCIFLSYSSLVFAQKNNELSLRYDKPAEYWEEALPLGNGQTGAMVFGGIHQERIQLNDHTLWSGYPESGNNPQAAHLLPVLREQIFANQFGDAEQTWRKMQGPYSARYLPLGDLWLDFDHQPKEAKQYSRVLDIQRAVSTTTYQIDGVYYERTVFVSHPAKAVVVHIKADKKGRINFKAKLSSKLKAQSFTQDKQLIMQGQAPKYVAHRTYFPEQVTYDDQEGMTFEARVSVRNKGGKVTTGNDFLEVSQADEVTLYLTEGTSFNGFDKSPRLQGKDVASEVLQKHAQVTKSDYNSLLKAHVSDYSNLFNRVSFTIKTSRDLSSQMTDARMKNFAKDATDYQLQALYFQFGRYLLISSSRPGSRPANLQGLWNDHVQPPWGSNYTININTEMNYWLAENTNLSECHQPLLSFIEELAVNGKETAKVNYGIEEGWMAHHNSDLWAKTSPVGNFEDDKTYFPGAFCWQMGGAWLSLHLWEHYQYTQDRVFLKSKAYPLMKGAAQFMLNWLVEDPESGLLVTAPSTSPENHFTYQGKGYTVGKATTMDMSIVRELLQTIVKAAEVLDTDQEFRMHVEKTIDKLYPFHVGQYGQLQEWAQDLDDPKDTHRHISQLFGLYPGTQISAAVSPDLVAAAKQTLEHRGDISTGWSMAWKVNWWARLFDGNRAHSILNKSFNYIESESKKVEKRRSGGGVYSNLFSGHPPFQIDANFGVTAGIVEMLMQSHEGFIRVLPALPDAWQTGEIRGIKTRGNFELNMKWENGQFKEAELTSLAGEHCQIVFPTAVTIKGMKPLDGGKRYDFPTEKGKIYKIVGTL